MVQVYKIFGASVGSHWLALATLGTVFGGSWAATRGPKKQTQQQPPINAQSKEEEDFINEFMRNAEEEDKKAKH